jgi:hypothetical protein
MMGEGCSLVQNMEELLNTCSRSIVSPELITREVSRVMAAMDDHDLEPKFIVNGCESLSFLASCFLRSDFDFFISDYARITGINHLARGFASKDELLSFCEFCVGYGLESLERLRNALMTQLDIENGMSRDEIWSLNAYHSEATVQDQIIDYIKLSLLVNSLIEFFRKYYKGLN